MDEVTIITLAVSTVAAIISLFTALVALNKSRKEENKVHAKHRELLATSGVVDPSHPLPALVLDPEERDE
jgi:hypothetical protein